MKKQITLVRRKADTGLADFRKHWREAVLGKMADMPEPDRPRYVEHCLVRQRSEPTFCDGIELAWFDEGAVDCSEIPLCGRKGDALEVGEPIGVIESVSVEERCVFGEEWLLERREKVSESACLLLGFIQRAPGLSREQFRDYWWEKHRLLAHELLPADLNPSAYIHDYVLSGEKSQWDGIGEMYETDLKRARRRGIWFKSPEAKALERDEENFMIRATRDVLITDHSIIL